MRKNYFKAAIFATAALAGLTTTAHATTINAATDGRWYQFDIDTEIAGNANWVDGITDSEGIYQGDYSDLSFTFTLTNPGVLTVVDGGIAGENFVVILNNSEAHFTSLVPDFSSVYAGTDFDAALADTENFSSLILNLAPGTYTVTGTIGAIPIGSEPITVGGLRISEVPLPASAWLFGTALTGMIARTRRRTLTSPI